MTAGSTSDWLRRVPKVELHLHLEGAIPHAALWELVQKYGGDPALPDRQALIRKFVYRNFPHFIETWIWKNRFLREYETWISRRSPRPWRAIWRNRTCAM